jgi:hypothetical protein
MLPAASTSPYASSAPPLLTLTAFSGRATIVEVLVGTIVQERLHRD